MPCQTCKKKKWYLKNKLKKDKLKVNLKEGERFVLINNRLGKWLYFIIFMLFAITPFINFLAIYLGYNAIFTSENEEKIDNNSESETTN